MVCRRSTFGVVVLAIGLHSSSALIYLDGSKSALEEAINFSLKFCCSVQDLHVQETLPQLIGLTEAYLLVYQRHGLPPPLTSFTPDGRPRTE